MYTYIRDELPKTLFAAFGDQLDSSRVSITGHSMGGHGAITLVSDDALSSVLLCFELRANLHPVP